MITNFKLFEKGNFIFNKGEYVRVDDEIYKISSDREDIFAREVKGYFIQPWWDLDDVEDTTDGYWEDENVIYSLTDEEEYKLKLKLAERKYNL